MCVRGGAEFTTADPEALRRQLDEDARFRRDGLLAGVFQGRKTSFREITSKDGLHILLEGDRIVVHLDEFAPFPKGSASGRYTPVAVGRHLFATTVGLLRRVRARDRKEYPRWFGSGCVVVEDDGVRSSQRFRAVKPAGVSAIRSPPPDRPAGQSPSDAGFPAAARVYRLTMTSADRDALRKLVEEGNGEAADRLAELAAADEDLDTLRYLIDAGNENAGDRLTEFAAAKQDIRTLNYLVDCGNERAADRLAEIAAEQNDVLTLQRLVDEGSGTAETLLGRVIRETK